jgi:hypothetical protein
MSLVFLVLLDFIAKTSYSIYALSIQQHQHLRFHHVNPSR